MIAAALALILLIDTRALERRRTIVAGSITFALMVIASLGHIGLAPKIVSPHPAFIPPVAGTMR
jgi:hypothetical protein